MGSGTQRCIAVVNMVTMLLSIPVVGTGFWLASKHDSECTRFLQSPILSIGFLMLFLSMAGFVGSCWAIRWLLWLYLLVMFLLIFTLLGFTTFALVVTSNESQASTGEGSSDGGGQQDMSAAVGSIHQYQLAYYSGWLTQWVQDGGNWRKIESCLAEARVCATTAMTVLPSFVYRHLSPLQLGCCKPPAICQFTNVNSNIWENPMNLSASIDCGLWANDPGQLCLPCSTCKAGLLANLKRDWNKVALLNVTILAFLLLVYALACCAFQNADKHRRRRHHLKKSSSSSSSNLPLTSSLSSPSPMSKISLSVDSSPCKPLPFVILSSPQPCSPLPKH